MTKPTKTLTIPNLISAMKEAGFATTKDLDKRLEGFATKDDLKGFATKADLKGFATKDDLKNFATKSDLDTFATKDGLKSLRKQINDDQFEARTEFYAKMTKPELDKLGKRIDKLDNKLSSEITWLKDDIRGLTAEFATVLSKRGQTPKLVS